MASPTRTSLCANSLALIFFYLVYLSYCCCRSSCSSCCCLCGLRTCDTSLSLSLSRKPEGSNFDSATETNELCGELPVLAFSFYCYGASLLCDTSCKLSLFILSLYRCYCCRCHFNSRSRWSSYRLRKYYCNRCCDLRYYFKGYAVTQNSRRVPLANGLVFYVLAIWKVSFHDLHLPFLLFFLLLFLSLSLSRYYYYYDYKKFSSLCVYP